LPDVALIECIRRLDPMKIHHRELSQADRVRTFQLSGG
jgi:glutaconate CoA-transferase subunit B